MCMGCMSTTDFLVTGGAVTVASLRVGLRSLLPVTPAFARQVSDDEAAAFIASLSSDPVERPDATVPAGC